MKLKSECRVTMKRKEKKEHTGIMQICRQELKFRVIQEGVYDATKLHKVQEEFLRALPSDYGVSLELLHRTLWVRPHFRSQWVKVEESPMGTSSKGRLLCLGGQGMASPPHTHTHFITPQASHHHSRQKLSYIKQI